MQGVQGEAAFETLARANELERQGKSIVHLEIGEPDFKTHVVILPRPVWAWTIHDVIRLHLAAHSPPQVGTTSKRKQVTR